MGTEPRRSRSRALLLVGHGSHLNGSSSAPVYEHAARLRATGLFDEVLEAFWKEEPSLRDALDLVSSDEVWVLPFFLADGYFTRRVVPRELGLDDRQCARGGPRIHYCPPIGAHPAMGDLVLRRALAVAHEAPFDPRDAALVVIGHGTRRSRTSGDTVHQLVERLRVRGEFGSVTCGFLDEAPAVGEVLEHVREQNVVLVPFFLADGWHVGATIPADLELAGSHTRRGEQEIWYTPPVGTMPEVADLALSIIRDTPAEKAPARLGSAGPRGRDLPGGGTDPFRARAPRGRSADGLPLYFADPVSPGGGDSPDAAMPGAIRGAFLAAIDAARDEGVVFMQIHIRRVGEDRYRITHSLDRRASGTSLLSSTDPEEALRIARSASDGAYRPLRSAPTLRRGWILDDLDADGLWRAVSLFYPAALLHAKRFEFGQTAVNSWEAWAGRQTGIYERLSDLDPEVLDGVTRQCCGNCLRTRVWRAEHESRGETGAPLPGREGVVPCPEPCTWYGTFARAALDSRGIVPVNG